MSRVCRRGLAYGDAAASVMAAAAGVGLWRSASGCGVLPLAGRGGVVAVLWALAAGVGLWRCAAMARTDGVAPQLWPGTGGWRCTTVMALAAAYGVVVMS
ncbi:hypothetical protein [Paenibacillus thiaminolyticus]|uniref:hypothetical protein n=1 Tax=Paenibacillus thiaminolyticus TaxID=49283 RepID=UPI002542815F|nr:hypothetical protein [Paenibacillus thiaminolyticus]WII38378.1 hypothetical protein O0V01_04370 [Paenibacillus thiaminolyticus]